MKKWMILLLASQVVFAEDKTPARKYHDHIKESAIAGTQIAIASKQSIWMIRNESGWWLSSVSFLCDTAESNDEHFIYAHADGKPIAPWPGDKHNPRLQDDPWGYSLPSDGEVVRHVAGLRQDLLDREASEWYVTHQRVFNCRVTDVELEKMADKTTDKKSHGHAKTAPIQWNGATFSGARVPSTGTVVPQ